MKKISALAVGIAMFFAATASTPNPTNEVSSPLNASASKAVAAEKVSKNIRTAFAKQFSLATHVNWKENENLYFVNFVQQNNLYTAAYSIEGEFVALSRELRTQALPLKVTTALKENYAGYSIGAEATEIVMDGETAYYLTVQDARNIKIIKCSAEGSISVFKKTKKKVLVGRVEV